MLTSTHPPTSASHQWYARAATLGERLSALRSGGAVDVVSTDGLAARWCRTAAGGDPARFARRLAALGIDAHDIARLAGVRVNDPPWLGVAVDASDDAIVQARALRLDDETQWRDDDTVPYGMFWRPWIEVGRARLFARMDAVTDPLLPALERQLRSRLVTAGVRAVHAAFCAARSTSRDPGPYRSWIRDQLADGYESLFKTYPVLCRLLSVITGQWVEVSAELLTRLRADRAALARYLGVPLEDSITQLRTAGDQHNGGREVTILQAASGARFVYKPRSIAPEAIFARAATRLIAHGALDVAVTPQLVERSTYGWAGFVAARACRTPTELAAYSRRAGAVITLARALAVSDLHFENVVPAGDRPVLVDLECVAHPSFRVADHVAHRWATSLGRYSVMQSGLLPDPSVVDRWANDMSGLTRNREDESSMSRARWDGLGTEAIRLERAPDALSDVLRDRDPLDMVDVPELLAGMRLAHRAIARHGLGIDLDRLRFTRVVPQGTGKYASIMGRALAPESLCDGLRFSITLDAVAEHATQPDALDWRLALADAERASLEQLDIPLVKAACDSTAVSIGEHVVADVLETDGRSVVRAGLAMFNPRDRWLQEDIARISLETRLGAGESSASAPPLADNALDVCSAIGNRLCEQAIEWRDGTIRWLNACPGTFGVTPCITGDGLYDGRAGIAVFLAALARTRDDERAADFARRALRPIRPVESADLAGGTAGIAFALAAVGALLDDAALSDQGAQLLLDSVTEEPIDTADVIGGRAGIVLASASVAKTTGSDSVARLAVTQARLLRSEWRELRVRGGHHAIHALRLGTAHGITGISLAVARALALFRDSDLEEWLQELVTLENERIAGREGIAARISSDGQRAPDVGWCWGTAGFVVSRSVVASVLGSAEARRYIDTAHTITAERRASTARLCCGSAGQLEALEPSDDEYVTLLDSLVRASGRFPLETGSTYQSAGLFRGVAGVAYALLRAASARGLPSVLSLDPVPPTDH